MQRIRTLAKVLQLGMSRRPANLLLGTRGSFEAVQLQELDTELGKIVQSFLAGQFGDFREQMAALGLAERALYLSEIFSKAEVLPAWEQLVQILKAGFSQSF